MIVKNSGIKMSGDRHSPRINTFLIKAEIEMKLGRHNADKYFDLLNAFLSLKMSKSEFDKRCIGTIGRENLYLHNCLIRSIIKNSRLSKTPPPKESKVEDSFNSKIANGYQRSCLQSLCRDVFPQSPRKGRTPNIRDRKFRDRPSPLGPHGKIHSVACEDSVPKVQEQQSATELLSVSSRPPREIISVEDGEEVEQIAESPSIRSRSPVRAPLGIPMNLKVKRKSLINGAASTLDTCHSCGELPDSTSLRYRLEQKLEMEGCKISADCINILNHSLNVFLKRLIKPCLESASSRAGNKNLNQVGDQVIPRLSGMGPASYVQKPTGSVYASMLDFRVAMELNPVLLGEDWPSQLEKISLRASEK
ncbi:uncharacterized protein LOC131152589 [Malania oleifera]|uniref:uncharacterized protein LOC131152589 n=1 Tax=Malania oleifera TaxID=397392 RepID=UPI0025AECB26|nr:uncharacterized protein LOC131152589 [Malania oleifera]